MDDSVSGNFYSTSCCHCVDKGSRVIYHSLVTQLHVVLDFWMVVYGLVQQEKYTVSKTIGIKK
jgi:hypothetical protein